MADKSPSYIADLLRPLPGPNTGDRRVWSIPLQAVWLPFFTATNVAGQTHITAEALGAPLRLARASDGSVKFSQTGRPVVRVVKELSEHVRIVRENFVASLVHYAGQVQKGMTKEYRAQVEAARLAGEPIHNADTQAVMDALKAKTELDTEASPEAQPAPQPQPELVTA